MKSRGMALGHGLIGGFCGGHGEQKDFDKSILIGDNSEAWVVRGSAKTLGTSSHIDLDIQVKVTAGDAVEDLKNSIEAMKSLKLFVDEFFSEAHETLKRHEGFIEKNGEERAAALLEKMQAEAINEVINNGEARGRLRAALAEYDRKEEVI